GDDLEIAPAAGHEVAKAVHARVAHRGGLVRVVDQDQVPAGLDVAVRFECFGQIFGAGHEADGAAVFQQEFDLARLVEDVDRHHHAARLENTVIGNHELGNVGQHDQHFLPARQPKPGQGVGQLVGLDVKLPVGQLALIADDRGAFGKALGVFREHEGQV